MRRRQNRVVSLLARSTVAAVAGVALAVGPAAASQVGSGSDDPLQPQRAAKLKVTSSAFDSGETIPSRHTCDGANDSPPLRWTGVPRAAKEVAIVLSDPDAPGGTFFHWVVFKLDDGRRSLAADDLPRGAREARNDFGTSGYDGPCPPPGDSPHRYKFTVYALDSRIGLPDGAPHATARSEIKDATRKRGTLTGRYGR